MTDQKRLQRTIKTVRSGQITIPADFRRALDITDDSLLQITLEGESLLITKLYTTPDATGSPWLAELYARFAPVREEGRDNGYTEEEINEAIAQAIAGVRARHA